MSTLSDQYPGVHFLHEERIEIGENVSIQPGTVVGANPLMTRVKDGKRHRLEIKGKIIIEDNVDIGAGCIINFGCGEKTEVFKDVMGRDTILKQGVFIGHQSNIGHDVIIEKHTTLSAKVCIGGVTNVGQWSYLALGALIHPLINIGNFTMIGTGSIVTKDIPDSVIAYGSPCKVVRDNSWRPQGVE